MIKLAYKVVKKYELGWISTSRAGLSYDVDQITRAPSYLLEKGYGICTFNNLHNAIDFRADLGVTGILLVNRIVPIPLPITGLSMIWIPRTKLDFDKNWDYATKYHHFQHWPDGTLMSEAVEVLEELSWRS